MSAEMRELGGVVLKGSHTARVKVLPFLHPGQAVTFSVLGKAVMATSLCCTDDRLSYGLSVCGHIQSLESSEIANTWLMHVSHCHLQCWTTFTILLDSPMNWRSKALVMFAQSAADRLAAEVAKG